MREQSLKFITEEKLGTGLGSVIATSVTLSFRTIHMKSISLTKVNTKYAKKHVHNPQQNDPQPRIH